MNEETQKLIRLMKAMCEPLRTAKIPGVMVLGDDRVFLSVVSFNGTTISHCPVALKELMELPEEQAFQVVSDVRKCLAEKLSGKS